MHGRATVFKRQCESPTSMEIYFKTVAHLKRSKQKNVCIEVRYHAVQGKK